MIHRTKRANARFCTSQSESSFLEDKKGAFFMPVPPMEDRKRVTASRHSVQLDRRENAIITGVVDVISFDEESVIGETEMGIIIIKGVNLHVKRINLEIGELIVAGEIDGVNYQNNTGAKAKSFMGKLFK